MRLRYITCKKMIVSVNAIGLGHRVHDRMMQHRPYFMQKFGPA